MINPGKEMQRTMKTDIKKGTVTLSKVGVRIEGTAKLHMWGGGVGYIVMDSFDFKVPDISLDISDDELEKKIKENLNDAGFGCESIDGAVVYISDLYEQGLTLGVSELTVGDITNEDLVGMGFMDGGE